MAKKIGFAAEFQLSHRKTGLMEAKALKHNPMILRAKAESIMSSFDFPRVMKVMKALNWRYGSSAPSLWMIMNTAKDLLDKLCENVKKNPEEPYQYVASGGFKASYFAYGELTLEFVASEASEEL